MSQFKTSNLFLIFWISSFNFIRITSESIGSCSSSFHFSRKLGLILPINRQNDANILVLVRNVERLANNVSNPVTVVLQRQKLDITDRQMFIFDAANQFCELRKSNADIVIPYKLDIATDVVQSSCKWYAVPCILTHNSDDSSSPPSSMTINISPKISNAIFDYILKLGWDSFIFIYNRVPRHMTLSDILNFGVKNRIRVTIVDTDSKILKNKDFGSRVWSITCDGERNFVIDMPNSRQTWDRFIYLQNIGVMTAGFNYLIIDPDIIWSFGKSVQFGRKFAEGGANITAVTLSEDTDVNTHEQNILKDSIDLVYKAYKSMCDNNNPMSDNVFFRARRSKTTGTVSNQSPLFYDRSNNCTTDPKPEERTYGNRLVSALKNQTFKGKSGLVRFDPYGRRVNFTVRFLTAFPIEGVTSWQTVFESLVYRPYSN